MGVIRFLSAFEHVTLNRLKKLRNGCDNVAEGKGSFDSGISAHSQGLLLCEICRSNLETKGDTLSG